MKMKIKTKARAKININIDTVVSIILAIYGFIKLEPYFTWETYKNGMFHSFMGVAYEYPVFLLVLICLVSKYRKIYINKRNEFLIITLLLSGIIIVGFSGKNYSDLLSGSILPYLIIAEFLMSPDGIKHKTYTYFKWIICLSIIPALVYHVLGFLSINIPYVRLESHETGKVALGFYYKNYPFAVKMGNSNPATDLLRQFKLCGMFDEHGRLGTVCALLLVSDQFKIKKSIPDKIFLIAGIFSTSLAFYLICAVYFTLDNLFKKKIKNAAAIGIVIVAYFVLINLPIHNDSVQSMINRIKFVDGKFVGDNRTNDQYNLLYENIYKADFYTQLFGYGAGAIEDIQSKKLIDGSSFKGIIYDYGFIGFGITLIWLIEYAYYKTKDIYIKIPYHVHIILIVYILNLYQRPSVFFWPYLLIFMGGILESIGVMEHE